MIVVIDYNVGNVKSVCNAFGHIGCDAKLSCEPADIESALGIVLPGVASFGYAVSALGSLADVIKDAASGAKPLLGICVGYQMLFDQSSEYGIHNGLGLIRGNVVPLPADQRVPHMGWNLVKLRAVDIALLDRHGQIETVVRMGNLCLCVDNVSIERVGEIEMLLLSNTSE
ncbi:MAG: imidazole glycerol phosphate synthase subunit HisH [Planctomycetota bacterium]|jgi:glutamine amidotransferase